MTTRKIGYARVSSAGQNLDRQIAALRTERCDEIFREKASGKAIKGRPQLERAIDELGRGDIFVIAEWDRATRSMQDGVAIIERIHAREASVKVLDRDYLDLTKPINRGILAFLSALAQDERERIHRRASEGRKAAKTRGVRFGRKPKLTEHQQAEALQRIAAGDNYRAIARTFGVHHATISRLG
jgi:DNA invertase Pin-like site-specific DNA recombinase